MTEPPAASRPRPFRRSGGLPYFLREGMVGFTRNGLMSVAAVTITVVTLTALGAALIMASTLGRIAGGVERQLAVVVYLRDGVAPAEIRGVGSRLARLPGVTAVTYVSKGDALTAFQRRLGGRVDLKDFLAHNPLPASFEVRVDEPFRLQAVAADAGRIPPVERASYGAKTVDHLVAVTRVVRWAGAAVSVGLALVAMIIIVNTIRLTVFARRTEIEVMRLVGATAWFIRWPFVIEGALTGAVAGAVAVLVVIAAYLGLARAAAGALPFLPLPPPWEVGVALAWKLMLWGVVIGIGASLLALRRFLAL